MWKVGMIVGWGLAIGLSVTQGGSVWERVTMGIFAAGAVTCLFQRTFPYRHKALAYSWVGPLCLPAARVVMNSTSPDEVWAAVLLYHALASIVILWFVRGYGAVVLMALLTFITGGRLRPTDDEGYPPRHWYLVPLFVLGSGVLLALVVQLIMHATLTAPPPGT